MHRQSIIVKCTFLCVVWSFLLNESDNQHVCHLHSKNWIIQVSFRDTLMYNAGAIFNSLMDFIRWCLVSIKPQMQSH